MGGADLDFAAVDAVGGNAVELVAVVCCFFFASIISTVAGVGGGMMYVTLFEVAHLMGATSGSLIAAMPGVIGITIIVNPVNSLILRHNTRWRFVLVVSMLWVVADFLGVQILVRSDGASLKFFLGWMMLVWFGWEALAGFSAISNRLCCSAGSGKSSSGADTGAAAPEAHGKAVGACQEEAAIADDSEACKEVDEERGEGKGRAVLNAAAEAAADKAAEAEDLAATGRPFKCDTGWDLFLAASLGIGGGFINGLVGIPMVTFALFIKFSNICKEEWRASSATFMTLTMPTKCYAFFVLSRQFQPALWPQYVGMVVVGVLAVPFGHRINTMVDQQQFRKAMVCAVLGGGLLLVLGDASFGPPLALCAMFSYGFIVFARRPTAGADDTPSKRSLSCGYLSEPAGSASRRGVCCPWRGRGWARLAGAGEEASQEAAAEESPAAQTLGTAAEEGRH